MVRACFGSERLPPVSSLVTKILRRHIFFRCSPGARHLDLSKHLVGACLCFLPRLSTRFHEGGRQAPPPQSGRSAHFEHGLCSIVRRRQIFVCIPTLTLKPRGSSLYPINSTECHCRDCWVALRSTHTAARFEQHHMQLANFAARHCT